MINPQSKLNLDTLGVGASTLCLVHCLAFPLLIAAVPLFDSGGSAGGVGCAGVPFDFWIHLALLGVVLPVGVTGWGVGYLRHKDSGILFLGAVGVAFLVTALMFGHHWMDGLGERVMTIAGSIAMVSAHLLNRRQCQCIDSKIGSQPIVGEPLALASNPTQGRQA